MILKILFLMNLSIYLVVALSMLIYWKTQKTYPGFGSWTVSHILAAVMCFLVLARPIIPVFFSIVVGNSLAVSVMLVRYEGVRHFTGKVEFDKRNLISLLVFIVIITYYTFVDNSPLFRLFSLSFWLTCYAGLIAFNLIQKSTSSNRLTSWTIGLLHLVYCIFLNARTYLWIINPADRDTLAPVPINIIFSFAEHILVIMIAISFLMLNIQCLTSDLFESQKELEKLATTDSLTGISNRRKLIELGKNEMIRSCRFQHHFSVVMFDIDHFKNINDAFGHPAGDKVLIELTNILQANIRESDYFGRLGGDEFLVLFPETDIHESYLIAERLRLSIGNHSLQWENNQLWVTISIGIVELSENDLDFDQLLKRVDANLYKAKLKGRNTTFGVY
ncbi:GGDEF domain-containing protein [Desulfosporosinus sp. SYSU MS00001]|uniref:GGDEF domain-containing protein n=1 Tax=Desulfosporosinus sp. SYSU MS00001 TaxID=3416284 RepID=UPI003CF5AD33